MSSVLSNSQFAEQVNQGGASRKISTGEEAPARGYYVSTPKFEKRFDRPVTSEDVHRHRIQILAERPSGYQGGWNENGTRFLDHSLNVNEFSNAIVLGRRFNQKSIYDAGKDSYHSGFNRRRAPASLQRLASARHRERPE